jgi:hypothetical protein
MVKASMNPGSRNFEGRYRRLAEALGLLAKPFGLGR